MEITEERELSVNPLKSITITLTEEEVRYIQRWAKPGNCYCFRNLSFVWQGSSTLTDLVLQIQKVEL